MATGRQWRCFNAGDAGSGRRLGRCGRLLRRSGSPHLSGSSTQNPSEPPLPARSYSPGCDVRKECYCATDSHCAAGFRCVRSKALPEFKVCKPLSKL